MKILAIDTTETACSAALYIDGETSGRLQLAPRRHSELILPMMDALLADAGMGISRLDGLAFARGPGSFTGVRIAAAVIQGAAFAADLPVVPVSSLRALAQGTWRYHGVDQVLAAFDARMQELYWGLYRLDGVMRLQGEERVSPGIAIQDWLRDQGGEALAGAGSGWLAHGSSLQCPGPVFPDHQVDARDVATLAVADFALAAVPAEQAVPVYIRNDVASKPLCPR